MHSGTTARVLLRFQHSLIKQPTSSRKVVSFMIVSTQYGKIEGILRDGCAQFLGIPYAAPPVGARRFKPPAPPEPWTGVRACKRYGSAAPQLYVEGLTVFRGEGETPLSEDCLYLNVTTPHADGEKRPVLFWCHGGAFQKGSATMGINELSFAREGVVVVNCNYRLGVLGFMELSEFLGEDYAGTGNTGLLDLVQALRWVRNNIAAFGGDPDNVTIAGQSAGAKIVGFLTCMRAAKGLFTKAVLMSGGVQCLRDLTTARAVTRQFMADAGLDKAHAKELLTLPWEEIVERQKNIFAGLNLHTVGAVFDGMHFTGRNALDLVADHVASHVPLLIGTNRDELDLYWHVYGFRELDDFMARRLFGDYADLVQQDVCARLAGLDKTSEDYHRAFVQWTTEYIYRAGCVQFAAAMADAGEPVYLFQNNWERGNRLTTKPEAGPLLACHCAELQFFFGRGAGIVQAPPTPAHEQQAQQMHGAMMQFIRTGTPAADGMPDWPPFTTNTRQMMVFDGDACVARCPLPQVDPRMPHQVFWLHE